MRTARASRLRWLALLQVLLILTMFAVPVRAETAYVPNADMVGVLKDYGIVKGDATGNLNLDKPIKRGEMMTILVRAVGREQEAQNYKGFSMFRDVAGHWAEGTINLAATLGYVKGDGNGLARPEDYITYGESLTLLLRLVGKEPTTGEWPLNVMLESMDLGILPSGISVADLGSPALRGRVFESMATAITTVKTADGKTFIAKYLDTTPPELTVNAPATTTASDQLTLTGTVNGAKSVTVNGVAAVMANGGWTANVSLTFGENKIVVSAVDAAGNTTVQNVTVTRQTPIATLTISGPAEVKVNGTAKYTVTAVDGTGKAVPAVGVTASVQGNIGTFDVATGTFTANGTAATGKIVVSAGSVSASVDVKTLGLASEAYELAVLPVNGGSPVSASRDMTAVVEVRDATGNRLVKDNGRSVTLNVSGLSGLSVSPSAALTSDGLATFTVHNATKVAGEVGFTATSTGLFGGSATAEFTTGTYVAIVPDRTQMVIGSTTAITRVRAELRNENGTAIVNNSDSSIYITLTADGDAAAITDSMLTIARGASSSNASGDDGMIQAVQAGTTTLRGRITSTQTYSVMSASVSVSQPTVGSGTRLQVVQLSSNLAPNSVAEFAVNVTDASGAMVTTGSYAFQVQLDTSNGETKQNGMPGGPTVTKAWIANESNVVVYDGYAEGSALDTDDVIGRTTNGTARIYVRYDKPGEVTLKVLAASSTDKAIASDGSQGSASSTSGFTMTSDTARFTVSASNIRLTVTSAMGTDQSSGAVGTGSEATVTAWITDGDGNWIPGINNTALQLHVGNSQMSLLDPATQNTTNGKVSWDVRAGTTAGSTTFTVTGTGLTPLNSVTIQIQNSVPAAAPRILVTRGALGDVPNAENYVAPTDDSLEIVLEPQTSVSPNIGVVKVYQSTSASLIYTSDAIDLSVPAPTVHVPKSKLPSGTTSYTVIFTNASGNSPRSNLSSPVVNAAYLGTGVSLGNARYNAQTHKLTVSASGLTTTTGAQIVPSKLQIVDDSTGAVLNLSDARPHIDNYSQFTLDMSDPNDATVLLASLSDIENPTMFSGADVTLEADTGWYLNANGDAAVRDVTSNQVTPLANVDYAVFDVTTGRLTIQGTGLSLVTLDASKIAIFDSAPAPGGTTIRLNSSGITQSSRSDTSIVYTLNTTAINQLKDDGDDVLNFEAGWLRDPSGATYGQAMTFTGKSIYADARLSGIAYNKTTHTLTLTGSGFLNAQATPSMLTITDLSTHQQIILDDTDDLGAATWEVVNDSTITITLTTTKFTAFENSTKFSGLDIYMTAPAGWMVKASGRQAPPIDNLRRRVPQP